MHACLCARSWDIWVDTLLCALSECVLCHLQCVVMKESANWKKTVLYCTSGSMDIFQGCEKKSQNRVSHLFSTHLKARVTEGLLWSDIADKPLKLVWRTCWWMVLQRLHYQPLLMEILDCYASSWLKQENLKPLLVLKRPPYNNFWWCKWDGPVNNLFKVLCKGSIAIIGFSKNHTPV